MNVVRTEEFSGIKNPAGSGKADTPDTARRDIYNLHRKWIEAAGGRVVNEGQVIPALRPANPHAVGGSGPCTMSSSTSACALNEWVFCFVQDRRSRDGLRTTKTHPPPPLRSVRFICWGKVHML